ncbi:CAP domain-containing protein [Photobacterium nomapromontoriensis]|uniref:CAP domain-containing protein n=1 Tax=Photobacterium nomapromontoriensis TaxID=2910237 RepID=UPI003D0D601D
MKVLPIFLLSALLLTGCGGGGSGSSGSDDSVTGTVPSDGGVSGGDTTINPGDSGNVDPSPQPVPQPDADFAEKMLFAVNQARSQQQNCGGQIMPAVPALTWNFDLEAAAFGHSSDMANGNFLSHTGSNGSTPDQRIAATGYSANAWAENVAAGQNDIDAVMASWMASSGHCVNIMSANVTQMGAAEVQNADTQYGIYWTQVFARPR